MSNATPRLTQRQRASQKAVREKAARKRMHTLWVRLRLIMIAGLALAVFGGGGWMWQSGAFSRWTQETLDKAYAFTASLGFTVEAMYLEGRSRTPMVEVREALGFKKGDPILALSLEELKARLEAISVVKEAQVERTLPHTLHVRLIEREPVALWQHEGAFLLIDEEGAVMKDLDIASYPNLPLLVGQGAPARVKEALALLTQEPELKPLVSAMICVGQRRWNVRLKQGIEVKLPQDTPFDAWKKLAELQKEQLLLMRDIRTVDMRAGERVLLKLPPADALSAKET